MKLQKRLEFLCFQGGVGPHGYRSKFFFFSKIDNLKTPHFLLFSMAKGGTKTIAHLSIGGVEFLKLR
jgi:hypothetical protein